MSDPEGESLTIEDAERGRNAAAVFGFPRPGGIEVALAHVEAAMIETALNQEDGVKRRAAVRLGISRYALERRLARVRQTLQNAPTEATS